jgi:co-chaperonin GroES (HSP10)
MTENASGIRPVEYKILIKPDPVEEMTAGGIIRPQMTQERDQWAQVKGTLVAFGGRAFEDWQGDREHLIPGARVYYRKYEGILLTGADGEEYRLCTDKDIGGIVENESAVPLHSIVGRAKGGLSAA